MKFKDHPNLARRNGKVLIFTYQTYSIMSVEVKSEGNGKNEPKRWRNFLEMLQRYRDLARKEFGTELFVVMDMDYSFGRVDLANIPGSRPPHQPGPMIAEMAAYLAKGEGALEPFDAFYGFLGNNWEQERELVGKKVIGAGGEWGSPLIHQFYSKGGGMIIKPGTDLMRETWDYIRASNSTLLQYATRNDYNEDASLAPGVQTCYAISDLTGYQIAWWKNGAPPKVDRDKVYLIFSVIRAPAELSPSTALCRGCGRGEHDPDRAGDDSRPGAFRRVRSARRLVRQAVPGDAGRGRGGGGA